MRTTTAVTLLVLVAVTPSVLAAEPNDHTVPLDTGYERVGNVTVNGTTYDVYRYNNLLPYVSGYEFFGDGRVEDSDRARRVRNAYAWETAVNEEMDGEDIERLREVGKTAGQAHEVVKVPLEATNVTLRVLGGEGTSSSAWGTAVSVLPALNTTETAVRGARDELLRWNDRVGNASDDVVGFAEMSNELQEGNTTRHDKAGRLAADAGTGLSDAAEASSTVAETLRGATNRTASVARRVENATVVGERFGPPLRRLETSLRNATATVEGFASSASEARDTVGRVRDRALEEEASLSEGWRARRSASVRLYGTGAVVLAVLIVGYLWRRRDHDM